MKVQHPFPATIKLKTYLSRRDAKRLVEAQAENSDVDISGISKKKNEDVTAKELVAMSSFSDALARSAVESIVSVDGETVANIEDFLDDMEQKDFDKLVEHTGSLQGAHGEAQKKTTSVSTN